MFCVTAELSLPAATEHTAFKVAVCVPYILNNLSVSVKATVDYCAALTLASLHRPVYLPLHQQEGPVLRQVQPGRGQAEPVCGRHVG